MKLLKVCLIWLTMITLSSCTDQEKVERPIYQDLTESVYCSVTIEPEGYYKVYATNPGIIDHVFAEEGDVLHLGDTILTIIDDPSNYQKQNAALELALAKENYDGPSNQIQELYNELRVAKNKLKNDSANYARQLRLSEQEIGSAQELEERQLAYQASKTTVDQIQNRIELKGQELKTQLLKAQNNYESNRFRNDEFVVRSKMSGKLYVLYKEKGESVHIQEPIAYVGSKDSFLIKMQVDEVDIVKVQAGQTIWVNLDAYADEVFEAKVRKIIPKMNQETQTFWVEGSFVNAPEVLYSGLRGESNIVIREKASVLTIPLHYLIDNEFVMTTKGKLRVETGLRSIERVEILSGIDTTTRLIQP